MKNSTAGSPWKNIKGEFNFIKKRISKKHNTDKKHYLNKETTSLQPFLLVALSKCTSTKNFAQIVVCIEDPLTNVQKQANASQKTVKTEIEPIGKIVKLYFE
ncbi:hypothetical protein WUBG_01879 [Wuchereria bancrofti]|uniref:Uncharacterized protein n=1 Tax=Wuchereria bancrofti TaxID=6293 RepID=J9EX73_WUCBA|nr:hypothetical protein WUBG_01879 [Wuchereria bancrofti]